MPPRKCHARKGLAKLPAALADQRGRRQMPLLVRNLHQRHLQQSCHRLSQAYPGQKAGI